jgi:hypothetical protein
VLVLKYEYTLQNVSFYAFAGRDLSSGKHLSLLLLLLLLETNIYSIFEENRNNIMRGVTSNLLPYNLHSMSINLTSTGVSEPESSTLLIPKSVTECYSELLLSSCDTPISVSPHNVILPLYFRYSNCAFLVTTLVTSLLDFTILTVV